MNWRTRTLIVVLTLAMVLGSASLAFAQGPTGAADSARAAVVRGEVTAVNDDGFTLAPGALRTLALRTLALRTPAPGALRKTPHSQEVTVVVTDDTRYRIPGVENPTLADVQVGMFALVRGTWEDGVFVAQGVGAASLDEIRRRIIQGEVTAVALDSGTLAVDTRRGEWTVHTTDDTRYRIPGVENPTLADVQVGDRVIVAGKPDEDSDNTGTARLIAVLPKNLVKGRGQVTAIEGSTLTVETRRGPYTVVADEGTRYRARDIEDPSLADVQVGDAIFVIGLEQDDGTILAKVIGILGQMAPGVRPDRPDDATVAP